MQSIRYIGGLTAFLLLIYILHFTGKSQEGNELSSQGGNLIDRSLKSFGNTQDCLEAISNGKWISVRCDSPSSASGGSHSTSVADPLTAYCIKHEWKWIDLPATASYATKKLCPMNKLSSKSLQQMFANKNIMFFGDSIVRSAYHAFISTLDSEYSALQGYSYKHAPLSYTSNKNSNITVQFQWTPFLSNITSELQGWSNGKKYANVHYLIMGSVLWDALYFHSLPDYERELKKLLQIISKWENVADTASNNTSSKNTAALVTNQMVRTWILPTTVLDERLATEEKRQFMNQQQINTYRQLIVNTLNASSLTATSQKSYANRPIHNIIDAQSVSSLRESSSTDGIHFSDEIYAVIAQMLANNYYLHFPKFYLSSSSSKSSSSAAKKPYVPKTTGSMSFPGYGAGLLTVAFIMLFTMDSFFGIGFLSLIIFGRSFDWESAYGPLHRKILNAVNEQTKEIVKSNTIDLEMKASHDDDQYEKTPLLIQERDNTKSALSPTKNNNNSSNTNLHSGNNI